MYILSAAGEQWEEISEQPGPGAGGEELQQCSRLQQRTSAQSQSQGEGWGEVRWGNHSASHWAQVFNLSLAYALAFIVSNVPYVIFELAIAFQYRNVLSKFLTAIIGIRYNIEFSNNIIINVDNMKV